MLGYKTKRNVKCATFARPKHNNLRYFVLNCRNVGMALKETLLKDDLFGLILSLAIAYLWNNEKAYYRKIKIDTTL